MLAILHNTMNQFKDIVESIIIIIKIKYVSISYKYLKFRF